MNGGVAVLRRQIGNCSAQACYHQIAVLEEQEAINNYAARVYASQS